MAIESEGASIKGEKRTSVGVKFSLVQVLDNLLDALNRAIPSIESGSVHQLVKRAYSQRGKGRTS